MRGRLDGCLTAWVSLSLFVLHGCAEDSTRNEGVGTSPVADAATDDGTGSGGNPSIGDGSNDRPGKTPSQNGGSGGGPAPTDDPSGMGGSMADVPDAGGMAPPSDPGSDDADGPVDGDANKPMVEVDGVPCGVPQVGFGSSPPSVKISDRDVVVSYPCAHEGADVTFFLFLHGTLQEGQKVPFTMNAFPIHEYVDSHNFIVVVPKAIGTQWGNGDNGQDLPHLYDVVDWVYETFGEQFDIRSMWASGGSWGAFYLNSTFACDPYFEDRLRGVRMVVGSGCPPCSDRLACIVLEQELEEGGGEPLTPEEQEMRSSSNIDMFASANGCDAKMKMPDLGSVRHWTWPNCNPGHAYSYYLGPGNHADPWNDPMAVPHMIEEIKSIE